MLVPTADECPLGQKENPPQWKGGFSHYRMSPGGGFRPQVPWLVLKVWHPTSSVSNPTTIQAVRNALSLPRIETYEKAVVATGDVASAAVALYDWNAQLSGAFMAPLHICEAVIRNAVSDALTAVYGDRWPWSRVFETSLPSPSGGYNPRNDLQSGRKKKLTTGKVIPELKFVFWQKMFTDRYDERIWDIHLRRVLPNLDAAKTVTELRQEIYADLEHVRSLRNRIAHHEPVFRRNLGGDLDKIAVLIQFRCAITTEWMMANQWVTSFLTHP